MSNLSDEQISVYEEPVNERVRKFIKIESYFDKMIYFKNKEDKYDSDSALHTLCELYELLNRSDLKSELIREIESHNQYFKKIKEIEGTDINKLNSLLEKQDSLLTLLHSVKSNYIDYLTNDVLFKTIYKIFRSPLQPAAVDYWLTRDSVWRTNNFDLWIEPLKFIKESTNFILTLIRKSGNFQDKNAEKGFYIQKLDQNKNIQLVRITLSSDVYYYPQISVGKQRINIMFMTKDEANNLVQYQEDVPFLLTICCL